MKNYKNNILKAISEGIQKGLDFTLVDFNDSDNDLYISKKEVSSKLLDQEDKELEQKYYEIHPRIKVGAVLYSNFKRNEKGQLLNLGDELGKPIGVCCIQPDFLHDKEARFIACNEFKAEWGEENEIKELPYIDQALTKSGLQDLVYLYSDKFNGYYDSLEEKNTSNPYIDVNKFNEEWLTPDQILSDLQGWKNQEIILKQQGTSGEYACQKCYNYKTEGTEIGEWYLPTAGELGIMFAKFNILNKSILVLSSNNYYWSSTQCTNNCAYYFNTKRGYIVYNSKNDYVQARPFFHIALASNFQNDQQLNESKFNFNLNDYDDYDDFEYIEKRQADLDKSDKEIEMKFLNQQLFELISKVVNDEPISKEELIKIYDLLSKGASIKLEGNINKFKTKIAYFFQKNMDWIETEESFEDLISRIKSTVQSRGEAYISKDDKMSLQNFVRRGAHYIPSNNYDLTIIVKAACIALGNKADLNWIDTSKITDMSSLFGYVRRFNGDISKWDLSQTKDISGLFYRNEAFNGDISNWDVSNVINFSYLFASSNFNGDISKWKLTANLINLSKMFTNSSFNQPIGNWDTSNVISVHRMFAYSEFNQDISNWDLSLCNANKNEIETMFYECPIKEEYKPAICK